MGYIKLFMTLLFTLTIWRVYIIDLGMPITVMQPSPLIIYIEVMLDCSQLLACLKPMYVGSHVEEVSFSLSVSRAYRLL